MWSLPDELAIECLILPRSAVAARVRVCGVVPPALSVGVELAAGWPAELEVVDAVGNGSPSSAINLERR